MDKEAQQLLDQLLAYHFMPVMDKRWSHVALFKEYARRMAWWASDIGIVNEWLTTNIVYALGLDDDLNVSPLQQLDAHLQSQPLYQPMPALLQAALMFAMTRHMDALKQFDRPNPYDVLVKLYTRGGYFRWNQRGFWEVSGAFGISGMDIQTYKVSNAFVSLDDEELDLIDSGDKQTNNHNL